jgi:hypothetical protein
MPIHFIYFIPELQALIYKEKNSPPGWDTGSTGASGDALSPRARPISPSLSRPPGAVGFDALEGWQAESVRLPLL